MSETHWGLPQGAYQNWVKLTQKAWMELGREDSNEGNSVPRRKECWAGEVTVSSTECKSTNNVLR